MQLLAFFDPSNELMMFMMLMAPAFRHVGWKPHHTERSRQHPSARCGAEKQNCRPQIQSLDMFFHEKTAPARPPHAV